MIGLDHARAVAGEVDAWRGRAIDIEPLSGGITNRNFLVTVDAGAVEAMRYVIRFPGESTELLGIDRAGEREASERAAVLGIGPPVLGELPGVGTMITRFVSGRHLEGADFDRRLADVVALVRRLHRSGPVEHSFPIHRIVDAHARDARSHGVDPPEVVADLLEQSRRIEAAFTAAAEDPVPCHNDLLPANVLFAPDRAWLLDFEYAGMNERFFDLGNLSVNAGLDAAADDALLGRYFDDEPTPSRRARLQLMKIMSEFREGMWAVVQQAISTLDTDFVAYADERLAHCRQLVTSRDYESWLLAARDRV